MIEQSKIDLIRMLAVALASLFRGIIDISFKATLFAISLCNGWMDVSHSMYTKG